MSTCLAPAFLAAAHTVIGPAPPNAAITVSSVTVVLAARASAIAPAYASCICRSAAPRVIPSGSAILLSIARLTEIDSRIDYEIKLLHAASGPRP
jgi:hypothetical protein